MGDLDIASIVALKDRQNSVVNLGEHVMQQPSPLHLLALVRRLPQFFCGRQTPLTCSQQHIDRALGRRRIIHKVDDRLFQPGYGRFAGRVSPRCEV